MLCFICKVSVLCCALYAKCAPVSMYEQVDGWRAAISAVYARRAAPTWGRRAPRPPPSLAARTSALQGGCSCRFMCQIENKTTGMLISVRCTWVHLTEVRIYEHNWEAYSSFLKLDAGNPGDMARGRHKSRCFYPRNLVLRMVNFVWRFWD